MRKKLLLAALVPFALGVSSASATVVSDFSGAYGWTETDVRGTGTASVADLTGQGGNLENNAPLPTGAAKLTTENVNADKAEVGIGGDFGTFGSFVNGGGTLSYDFYKSSTDTNLAAAASIKLTVLDGNTNEADGYTSFVYEQYLNTGSNPTTDTWTNVDLSGDSGIFWHTGLYGDGDLAGSGADQNTLADWLAHFGSDLLDATIVGISVGVGSYNQGQTAFFDDVRYGNGQVNLAYDFEVSAVPLPAGLPLYGAGLAALGFFAWRRKRKIAEA